MNSFDINSLNEEQLAPLKATDGAVLVTAGAGSGKTRLLTHRVAYLIEQGVSPYNILAITFTNKATAEMKERISNMVDGAKEVWISTFHSMCAQILRREMGAMPPYTKNFSIYSESDSDRVLKEVFSARKVTDDKIKKEVSHHISGWKNSAKKFSEYVQTFSYLPEARLVAQCIVDYQKTLQKNNALDFDDLIRLTIKLFREHADIWDRYARRFKYIHVDEFQDTNSVQYLLVRMLASVHGNIFVVGDEDQCIYSWRGANFKNIFRFREDYPHCQTFKLERNYRSSSSILLAANNIIKNNRERLDKKMWTDRPEGSKPTIYRALDERDEALFVSRNIQKHVTMGGSYSDCAVLMRMSALSRPFETAMLDYNVPHRIFGGFKFFDRTEVKNVIAYLKLFVNPLDDVSMARIINYPKRGIGDGGIAKIKKLGEGKSMLQTITDGTLAGDALEKKLKTFTEPFLALSAREQTPLSDFVEDVISQFKLREMYDQSDEEDADRLLNMESLVTAVREFEDGHPDATLSDFLESVTLSSDTDEIGQGGQVTISTIHAVKGLEFKVVFLVGLEEGLFPSSRTIEEGHLEEERRLMYVAVTRAEDKLYLTHAQKRFLYGQTQYQRPSRFLKEMEIVPSEPIPRWGKYTDSQKSALKKATAARERAKKNLPPRDLSVFKIGTVVTHPTFGEGPIVAISSDGLVADINFEQTGKKSIMLEFAKLEVKKEGG